MLRRGRYLDGEDEVVYGADNHGSRITSSTLPHSIIFESNESTIQVRRPGNQMIIHCRAVPPFQKNGFVVACERTRQGVMIDPGDEVDALLDVVRESRIDVALILL